MNPPSPSEPREGGPYTVHLTNGDTLTYDRVHATCGWLFGYIDVPGGQNINEKVPAHRIEWVGNEPANTPPSDVPEGR